MLFDQEVSYFDDVGPAIVAVQITSSSNSIQNGISERVGLFFQFNSMWVTAIIVALVRSWELTLVTLCIIPGVLLIYALTIPTMIKLETSNKKVLEEAAALAQETFATIRTVVAFGAQKNLGARYQGFLWASQKIGRLCMMTAEEFDKLTKRIGIKKGPIIGTLIGGGLFGVYAGFALCFWYGIRIYLKGRIHTSGTIVTVLFSILYVSFTDSLVLFTNNMKQIFVLLHWTDYAPD